MRTFPAAVVLLLTKQVLHAVRRSANANHAQADGLNAASDLHARLQSQYSDLREVLDAVERADRALPGPGRRRLQRRYIDTSSCSLRRVV